MLKGSRSKTTNEGFESILSTQLKTGDFIKLFRDQMAPCDILLLHSSEKYLRNYVAYCETSANDGSVTYQMKKCLLNTSNSKMHRGDFNNMKLSLNGHIQYSHPSANHNNFEAFLKLRNDPKVQDAGRDNLLVKGSNLKNSWVVGLVLYVGTDCKPVARGDAHHFQRESTSYLENKLNG